MAFSEEWDKRYADNTHMSIWPWSDIISMVHRHCKTLINKHGTVLELGCGAGANIPFFLALGMDYYAVEGSSTIVKKLSERFPELAQKIVIADFTKDIPFNLEFDLVVDRASVTHNNSDSIKNTLNIVFDLLSFDGAFIGSDWFSIKHDEFKYGQPGDDEFTRENYNMGPFFDVGTVHFSDEQHLLNLFSKFEILFLEEKTIRQHNPRCYQSSSWNIIAKKPA